MALPIADWLQALERMDDIVTNDTRELDCHEQSVSHLLEERGASSALHAAEELLARIDETLDRHDRDQRAAAEHAATFEQWLGEQDAAIRRWQASFGEWCETMRT